MEELFRVFGICILMWMAYASGKWQKQNSYEKGVEDELKAIDHAFKAADNLYASKGNFAEAWHAVNFLLQPNNNTVTDLSLTELYKLGGELTKERLGNGELIRVKKD